MRRERREERKRENKRESADSSSVAVESLLLKPTRLGSIRLKAVDQYSVSIERPHAANEVRTTHPSAPPSVSGMFISFSSAPSSPSTTTPSISSFPPSSPSSSSSAIIACAFFIASPSLL